MRRDPRREVFYDPGPGILNVVGREPGGPTENGSAMKERVEGTGPKRQRYVLAAFGVVVGLALLLSLTYLVQGEDRGDPGDRALREMISRVDESEIYRTTVDLQEFETRVYPSAGNSEAADYLHDRLAAIPGLEVGHQNDRYRNIIATLPGEDPASDELVIVGAHYDSESSDPEHAPGATDNGGGVAIVLELARVMSDYRFNHTVQFVFWNAEEDSRKGSRDFLEFADENSLEILLYMNYDSSCYDPDDRYVLDVMYNDETEPFAQVYADYNAQYGIGFNLTYNVHECGSDHSYFWKAGYPAVTTHCEEHSPHVHTPEDTVDSVNTEYAAKNARLGALVLSGTAGIRP